MTLLDSRPRPYLTVADIAGRLMVSQNAVRSWLQAGRLVGTRLPANRLGWRVTEEDYQRFVKSMERVA